MSIKVYNFSRLLEKTDVQILQVAREEGIQATSHMSTLSAEDMAKIRGVFRVIETERQAETRRAEEARRFDEERKAEDLRRAEELKRGETRREEPVAVEAAPVAPVPGAVEEPVEKRGKKKKEKEKEKDKDKDKEKEKGERGRPGEGDGERKGEKKRGDRKRETLKERRARIEERFKTESAKRRSTRIKEKDKKKAGDAAPEQEGKIQQQIAISLPITLKEISAASGIKGALIIQKMFMQHQMMLTINQFLDQDQLETITLEFDLDVTIKKEANVEEALMTRIESAPDRPEDLVNRPPVVTFLGHVDHGKTSLLDAIRGSRYQETEAGGITQHFSAWMVNTPKGKITFLDTPGHKLFTEMRSRGANVTDIVVLVIAADDGVMPQTEEAISHARAAGVPIIVALNKMDKSNADPQKVLQQLASVGLHPEEWEGDIGVLRVSATTGQGIEELLEYICLTAEVAEIKANPHRPARGYALESKVDQKEGRLITLLVKEGTLRTGDVILCGDGFGKVRRMTDDTGRRVKEAPPSTAVDVAGISEVTMVGESFYVLEDLQQARDISEKRTHAQKRKDLASKSRQSVSLETLFTHIEEGKTETLAILVKADVIGSVEVLRKSIEDLSGQQIKTRVIHAAVGGVNESDVLLAHASQAVIIAFNVVPEDRARQLADEKGVEIRRYDVIYKLLEELTAALEGMLAPEEKEEITGHAEIRKVFRSSRLGNIAGCYVTDGVVERSARCRLIRDNKIIRDKAALASLRREKDDVNEVKKDFECGLRIQDFDDVKEGDRIEFYKVHLVETKLLAKEG